MQATKILLVEEGEPAVPGLRERLLRLGYAPLNGGIPSEPPELIVLNRRAAGAADGMAALPVAPLISIRIDDDPGSEPDAIANRPVTWLSAACGDLEWVRTIERVLAEAGAERLVRDCESRSREQAERLQAAAAGLPGVIFQFVRRPDGRMEVVYLSEGIGPILDRPVAEAVDRVRRFEDLHPEDAAAFWTSVHKSAAGLSPWAHEFRVRPRDGSPRWIRGVSTPSRMPDGGVCWNGVLLDVTAQREAEERARLQDSRLSLALEAAELVTWELDVGSGQLSYSQSLWSLADAAEAASMLTLDSFLQQVHPEDRPGLERAIASTVQGGATFDREYRLQRTDGSWRWVSATGKAVMDGRGQVTRVVGVAQDISVRKQAVAALRARELQLRTLGNNLPGGFLYQQIAQPPASIRFTYVSTGVEDLFGITAAEIMANPGAFLEMIVEEDRAAFFAAQIRSARELVLCDHEFRQRARNGEIRWIHVRSRPRALPDGSVLCDGLALDVTARRRLEEDLLRLNQELEQRVAQRTAELSVEVARREAREIQLRKFGLAVEQSPAMVMITDAAGVVEYVNPQFERETGFPATEAIGRTLRELQFPAEPPEFHAALGARLDRGEIWRGELANRRRDGSPCWELVAIAPVTGADERITHFVAMKEDITEQRRVAEELRQAKEAADAANRAKSVFLANMSHEIRTPMNAILGFTQLLRRDPGLSDSHRQRLHSIEQSGDHLLKVINDLLEMARIESGRIELSPEAFDPAVVLRDLGDMFALRARTQGIELRVETAPAMPRHLVADPTKLRQVLINLLGNAFKFTPAGGYVRLALAIAPRPDGTLRLEATVEDTGPGMAPDEVSRLFQPFFQTHAGRAAGGSGLGLAISRQFAQLMGGDLTVSSQPGGGSRFTFHCQVREADVATASMAPTQRPAQRLRPAASGERVLVVDDSADNREVLRGLLAPLGFEVREAAGGLEALTHCAHATPRLAIMDLLMPDLDGFETTRRLRGAHGRSFPILAMSASVGADVRARAFEAGADAFLGKPFKDDELLDLMAKLLDRTLAEAGATPGVPAATFMESPEAADAGDLDRLPAELRNALRRASMAADQAELVELAKRARGFAPALGRHLLTLIERYDLELLQALLGEEDDEHAGDAGAG